MNNVIVNISFAKIYKYRHICFEWHNYLGPVFLRRKDHDPRPEQYRPMRDYAMLSKWLKLNEEDREVYRVV